MLTPPPMIHISGGVAIYMYTYTPNLEEINCRVHSKRQERNEKSIEFFPDLYPILQKSIKILLNPAEINQSLARASGMKFKANSSLYRIFVQFLNHN